MAPRCPTNEDGGLVNRAGCDGPLMMRSALALLLSARQQIFDGRCTAGRKSTSSSLRRRKLTSAAACAAASVNASQHAGPPSIQAWTSIAFDGTALPAADMASSTFTD